ncbi:MAG: glutaminase, partial [Ilumatobacter sp.]
MGERTDVVLSLVERYIGRRPDVDRRVFESERSTGHRNRAIAYLFLDQGVIDDRVDDTLDVYFRSVRSWSPPWRDRRHDPRGGR